MQTEEVILNKPQPYHLQLSKRLLIVEDEILFARAVVKRFTQEGFNCERAENIEEGKMLIKQFEPDLVLLDMRLPDGNGLDLLTELMASHIPTIVMTAYGDISDAVTAMKIGALDYLKKPIDLEELLLIVNKNHKAAILQNSVDYAKQRNAQAVEGVPLIGESFAMQSVHQQIQRIAKLSSMADAIPPAILITGETGTGKDVVARYLHAQCANSDKPFVQIDCTSLPSELIESELFGHEKGAFTNAHSIKPGLIESAEDGTLFLDEIGELPLIMQAKLLNVLERRCVRRLGSTKERPVKARIIAATNRDLHQMVNQGQFRADLYYRLNVITLNLPPLRERADDIMLLASYFKRQTEKRYGLSGKAFSPSAVQAVEEYRWPGNVRELKNQISRAVLLSTEDKIVVNDLSITASPLDVFSQHAIAPLAQTQITLDVAEKTMIINALEQSRNNVSKAARLLGITRMTMRYRMEKHGISS